MPLSPGEKLGPYEILSAIGAGGMGEVYKARDTRLARTVAIKVLPAHIAQRDELRARFEREARTVAGLNHPNICTLHDIGRHEDKSYMVMELIEGETLAQRIKKGPIPLDQALKIAVQIGDALDRAHRAGVTHRDVKPQNIMLSRDGVKVLDFGLAKSHSQPGSGGDSITQELTRENTLLGTPQYMAPEQFEGREVDARSDIWAFGTVLYEMVTGRRAFNGKDYQSLISAILATDPPGMDVNSFTPSWLERLVRRCLEKDPDERYQSIRDVVLELRKPPADVTAVAPKPNWRPWAAGTLALSLLAAGAGWYLSASRPPPLRPLMRLDLEVPPETPLARVDVGAGVRGNVIALSPDGARLALSLRSADGKIRLHTRLLNLSRLQPLFGSENAHAPFFSPAGDWIGFFADGKLKKIAVEGGAAVTLCDAPYGLGGAWGDDGNIIAALNLSGGLSRVPATGGAPLAVSTLSPGDATHRWPQLLPGTQTVIFTAAARKGAGYDNANIDVISLRTGERKTIHQGGFFARYLPGPGDTGHLIFLRQSTAFAVPFHPGRLAVTGAPVPILEDVRSTQASGGDFAVARNGTFVYLAGETAQPVRPVSWIDRAGKSTHPLHPPPGISSTPNFSPDGKRLAFSLGSGKGQDIWVKDLVRDSSSRLTFLPGTNDSPIWTPDGRQIVFNSDNPAAPGLYAIRSDGSGEARRLTDGNPEAFPYSFSADGKRLAILQTGNGGSFDIFTLPVESGADGIRLGKPEVFLGTPFEEGFPMFSPNGRWMAYQSTESGTPEVYVRPFPGPGGRWQVSTGGGRAPVWSRDGRELLFQAIDGSVMAVSYTAAGDSFAPGPPRLWTETRIRPGSHYDIAPDGKRLTAAVADAASSDQLPTHLTFLLNFADELRRNVAVGQ